MAKTADRDGRGIAFGGDYSPDQWPEEIWDDDIRLMGRPASTPWPLPSSAEIASSPSKTIGISTGSIASSTSSVT